MEGPDLGPAHDQLFCWTYRQQKQRGFTAFLHYWLKAAFQILADCMQAWQCDSGRASMRGRERDEIKAQQQVQTQFFTFAHSFSFQGNFHHVTMKAACPPNRFTRHRSNMTVWALKIASLPFRSSKRDFVLFTNTLSATQKQTLANEKNIYASNTSCYETFGTDKRVILKKKHENLV